MAWYKVISHTNVSVNHLNGAVHSLPYGTIFAADPNNPDVRTLMTRFKLPKVVAVAGPADNAVPLPGPSLPVPSEQAPAQQKLPSGINDIASRVDAKAKSKK